MSNKNVDISLNGSIIKSIIVISIPIVFANLLQSAYQLIDAFWVGRLWADIYWVSTNLQNYIYDNYYDRTEVLSRIKAFLEVEILKQKPKFLWEKVYMTKPQEDLSELNVYD